MQSSTAAASARWPASFWHLLSAQTQVPFNDNAVKALMIGLAAAVMAADPAHGGQTEAAKEQAYNFINTVAGVLIALPLILFSPFFGWIADAFPKHRVLRDALLLQVVAMAGMLGAIAAQSIPLALVAFAVLAVQNALFSPAKQGVIKEMVGGGRLGQAVGYTEAGTSLGILFGMAVGGPLFDYCWGHPGGGDPWAGAFWAVSLLAVPCLIVWGQFFLVRATPKQSADPFRWSIFYAHFFQLREVWRIRRLRFPALGVGYFYTVGAILFLTLPQLAKRLYGGGEGTATQAGLFSLYLGLGIAGGNVLAGWFHRRAIEIGWAPLAGLLIPALLGGLAWAAAPWVGLPAPLDRSGMLELNTGGLLPFNVLLFLLGVAAALFLVTCYSYLQEGAPEDRRGRILATCNIITNVMALGGMGIFAGFTVLQVDPAAQFWVLVPLTLLVGLYCCYLAPAGAIRVTVGPVIRALFRPRLAGLNQVPRHGGAVVICNHVSYFDAVYLAIACPRPLYFLGSSLLLKNAFMRLVFRAFNTIPVHPLKAKEAYRKSVEVLQRGDLLAIFPEGELSRTGTLHEFREGFVKFAQKAGVPIIPACVDRLFGSFGSYSESVIFQRKGRRLTGRSSCTFMPPISPQELTREAGELAVLRGWADDYRRRPEFERHLASEVVRAMRANPKKIAVIDRTATRREFTNATALGVALTVASELRKLPEKRVGILLPSSGGGTIANLAVVLAGKVPVNLNFTIGRAAAESCLRQAGLKTVLTDGSLRSRFTEFPWPEDTRNLKEMIEALGRPKIAPAVLAATFLPAGLICALWKVPTRGGDAEAALLFSSGSTGEPKGVVLTHRNILSNSAQIHELDVIPGRRRLLACLPIFHSFGFTIQLWHCLLRGVTTVTLPNPLEAKKIAEVIKQEQCHVLLGTPTFFRPYLKRVEPEDLASLELVVAGAEKTPAGFREQWEARFPNAKYLEGYGLTETSPVLAVNLPDPVIPNPEDSRQTGTRAGSVGRLLPGIDARIVDPEDPDRYLPLDQQGILAVRGANIFPGYLGQPELTAKVFNRDGYFITGDLARFDNERFLFIDGRLSRFSKIGGEMVPHGKVESEVIEVLGLANEDRLLVAVAGAPDEAKGEQLVLLAAMDVDLPALREKLEARGLPNLFLPKKLKRVDAIPVLGTGKLDLKTLQRLAREP